MDLARRVTRRLSPAQRGSLFYLGYWGFSGVYMPFINVYFERLGLSGQQLGFLSALLPGMTFLIGPVIATVADRRSQRVRFLVCTVLALAGALALLAVPRHFGWLVGAMTLVAMCRCSVGPLGDSVIARMAARHRVQYGRQRLWGSFGFAGLALVCGWLWQRVGFEPMFVVAGLLCLPVALVASSLEESPPSTQPTRRPLREIRHDVVLIGLLLASLLVGAAIGMDVAFEGILMDRLGGSELMIGALFCASALSEVPTMQYASAMARRWGSLRTLGLSYGLLGLGFLGFALAWNPWVLLLLSLAKGMGFGLYFVSTVHTLDERVPPEWAASVQGLMNAGAWGLGPLIAGPLSGAIYDGWGVSAVFIAATLAIGLAALVLAGIAWVGWDRQVVQVPQE